MTQRLKAQKLVHADSNLAWLRHMINAADELTRGKFDWSDGDPVYTLLRRVDWDAHTVLDHVDPLLKAKTTMNDIAGEFKRLTYDSNLEWTGVVRLAFNEYVNMLEADAGALSDKLGDNHHHVINLTHDIEKNVTGFVLKGSEDLSTQYQDMIQEFNADGGGQLFEAYYGDTVVQAYNDLADIVRRALSNLTGAAKDIKDDRGAVKIKTKP